jgi:hypothetical protein
MAMQSLSDHSSLILLIAILFTGLLSCSYLAWRLRKSRSQRPAAWLAALFLLFAAIPLQAWVRQILRHRAIDNPRTVAFQSLANAANPEARTTATASLFGPDASPAQVRNVQQEFGPDFAKAVGAWADSSPNTASTILALYPTEAAAARGFHGYLRYHGIPRDRTSDGHLGLLYDRPVGGRLFALRHRKLVGIWIADSDTSLRTAVQEAGIPLPAGSALNPPDAMPPGLWDRYADVFLLGPPCVVCLLFLLTRGLSWAGGEPPRAGTEPAPLQQLVSVLNSLNELSLPVRIRPADSPQEFIAEWRLDVPRWRHLAVANRIPRLRRIRLSLDADSHRVVGVEQTAEWCPEEPTGQPATDWRTNPWLVFFLRPLRRSPGIVYDAHGIPHTDTSARFEMRTTEFRDPLISVITRCGWEWRPLLSDRTKRGRGA